MPRWPPGYKKRGPKTARRESSETLRAEWASRAAEGASVRKIASEYGVPPSTVSFNLRKAHDRGNHASDPRSGRPRKTTRREDRQLKREAVKKGEAGRRQTLIEVTKNVVPHVSKQTVRRRLREAHIQK